MNQKITTMAEYIHLLIFNVYCWAERDILREYLNSNAGYLPLIKAPLRTNGDLVNFFLTSYKGLEATDDNRELVRSSIAKVRRGKLDHLPGYKKV